MSGRSPTQLRIDEALGQLQQLAARKAGEATSKPAKAPTPRDRTLGRPRVENAPAASVRILTPPFLVLVDDELRAIWNRTGNPVLCRAVYELLCFASTLDQADPKCGHFLTYYRDLEPKLRGPKPERGQWAAGPTRKQVRGAIDQLEAAGLVWRDHQANADLQQLRGVLLVREDAARRVRRAKRKGTP